MKLGLIGHGAMGRIVESLAISRGHTVSIIPYYKDTSYSERTIAVLKSVDVAIDFSVSTAVYENIKLCLDAGVPLVEGVTGWLDELPSVREMVLQRDGSLVYGANFSIGVNVFYRLVEYASRIIASLGGYEPFIEELHHSRKRDAPSGTAINLEQIIVPHFSPEISVAVTRAGHIPGTHRVGFDSLADTILLTHMARSREGFAAGALLAAEWICSRKGFFEFQEVLDALLTIRKD